MAVARWVVYLILASDGSLYTGITTDPARRLREHQRPGRGARYFNTGRRPQALVYQEPCTDRASACRREAAIKRLPRAGKLALVRASQARDGALEAPVDVNPGDGPRRDR